MASHEEAGEERDKRGMPPGRCRELTGPPKRGLLGGEARRLAAK